MDSSTQIVVSLSTIPPRFNLVGNTLNHILNQSISPNKIELYIPKHYKRFPEHEFTLPQVPNGVDIILVNEDIGPATKVLHCAKKYQNTNTRIFYCDDDHPYFKDWLKWLIEETKIRPHCCIANHGFDVDFVGFELNGERNLPRARRRKYGIEHLYINIPYWINGALFQIKEGSKYKPKKSCLSSGFIDIAEGFAGVSVSPDFYSEISWNIPKILWGADDIYLSGWLGVKGVGIWCSHSWIAIENTVASAPSELKRVKINGCDRFLIYDKGIRFFRDKHNIWK